MFTSSEAIEKLEDKIQRAKVLKSEPMFSPEFKKWRRDTEVAIENLFEPGSRHVKDFSQIRYSPYMGPSNDTERRRYYHKVLDVAIAVLSSLIDEIREFWTDASRPDDNQTAPLARLETLCSRFHLIARSLRSRYDDRETLCVEDEYDVQDLFKALLHLDFDDIRPEEYTPSYAGGSSRIDFLLKNESLVIEIKKTRKGLADKQVGEQLLIDVGRYKSHPCAQTLLCFVYDPEGRIGNPVGLEADLNRSSSQALEVVTLIYPKGH